MLFGVPIVKALNLFKVLRAAALVAVFSVSASFSSVDEEHTDEGVFADALAVVQTDRQQADVLREESLNEIEDHYGDADLFKRYIINRPLRAV